MRSQLSVRHTLMVFLAIGVHLNLYAGNRDPSVTPEGFSTLVQLNSSAFKIVRENQSVDGIRRQVMGFTVDGLRQYALVLWPQGDAPEAGWPVLQFNHGYHPDPPKNGMNAQGVSDRPGDYYRAVTAAFANAGYVVVAPDYRGHNVSEGFRFTQRIQPDLWYTRDAIACFLAALKLEGLNPNQAYMLGHSMGGVVTLRAVEALADRVGAAAIWSSGDVSDLAALDVPLSIQHSKNDGSVSVKHARALSTRLADSNSIHQINIYPGSDHLFKAAEFDLAVARDTAFFERYRGD